MGQDDLLPNLSLIHGTVKSMETIEQPVWYRKYWSPYGKVTGFHDVGYITVNGKLFAINRHLEKETEKVMFYVPNNYTDGWGHCLRYEEWNDLVNWCAGEGQTACPCT